MKIRHLIKTLGGGALVAAVLAFSSSANAVTQLIHFDDASNGWKWYSTYDRNFLFDPTNLQSASLCADSVSSASNQDSCVIEGNNGVLPLMTRPESGPTSQGGPASPGPDVSGALEFTLDSFYFNLTGNGTGAENAITVEGSNGVYFELQLGGTYAGPLATDPVVTFYEGLNAGDAAGALVKDTGYIASFGDLFANVTWIQFGAPTTAQVRLDCIVATHDGTHTPNPNIDFVDGVGCGISTEVPEPGTLALMGLGLAGMGLARRRKKV